MPIDCDPNALSKASSCYRCITGANAEAVKIYLLAVTAGLDDLTPDQLMERAKCYNCIPLGMQKAIQNYLLCQLTPD